MNGFEPIADRSDEIFISISSNGMFYIPNRVYEKFFDGERFVAVERDVETKRIALRPLDERAGKNTYELRDNRGYGRRFSCLAVLTDLGIDLDETIRLEPQWSPQDQAIVLSLAGVVGQ